MILYFSCFVCGGAHLAASPPDAASGLRPQYTSHNYTVICDMTQGAKLVWCSCRRQPVNQLRGGGEVYKLYGRGTENYRHEYTADASQITELSEYLRRFR